MATSLQYIPLRPGNVIRRVQDVMSTKDENPWSPHGLITRYENESVYLRASIKRDTDGSALFTQRCRTTSLFENTFHRVLFPEDKYFVNSTFRPNDESEKVADVTISKVDYKHGLEMRPMMFCFAAGEDDGPLDVKALEERAASFCVEYSWYNRLPKAHVCTLIGATMRCWKYEERVGTMPLWGHGRDGLPAYKDVGKEDDARLIIECFGRIKASWA